MLPAHPRSRGENSQRRVTMLSFFGSSPLTRGKPSGGWRWRGRGRLIPAHAGKTARVRGLPAYRSAHPRSRGENAGGALKEIPTDGSSPLTRGKREPGADHLRRSRLIPAHAGKTPGCCRSARGWSAHPRSRGENLCVCLDRLEEAGSSPLTRGKHHFYSPDGGGARLIPAHAGKTTPIG